MIWVVLVISIIAVMLALAISYVVVIRFQEQDEKIKSLELDINNLREAIHLISKELRYEHKR